MGQGCKADNSDCYQILTEEEVNRAGRTVYFFLHSSRTNPSKIKREDLPDHLKDKYTDPVNDITSEVVKILNSLASII
jgi:6-phosphofructokinase 1